MHGMYVEMKVWKQKTAFQTVYCCAHEQAGRISIHLTIGWLHSTTKSAYSRTPFIRTLVIRIANYPDRLGPSGKFVDNSTKLTILEITCYRIKYSTVLWLTELQIRRGRKVQTPVHTVNSDSRTANCQYSLFSQKNPIIRNFCISGWLAVRINPNMWKCTVFVTLRRLTHILIVRKQEAASSTTTWHSVIRALVQISTIYAT